MKNNIVAVALSRQAVITLALVSVASVVPLVHSQLVTGTIVNATILAAALLVGFRAAASVAVIPSLIAMAAGTLPAAMAVMVPYIILSNILLAGMFSMLKNINYWLAAGVACLAKFSLLVISSIALLTALTHGSVGLALASMMGWPQLITASLGAVVVWAVFERK